MLDMALDGPTRCDSPIADSAPVNFTVLRQIAGILEKLKQLLSKPYPYAVLAPARHMLLAACAPADCNLYSLSRQREPARRRSTTAAVAGR